MPLRKSPHALRRTAGLVIAASALVSAAPATSSASSLSQNLTCTAQTVTSPFAKWGDLASYWLAPDGGFEAGAKGWQLKGAKVVTGNETLGVFPGSKALQLGGKGVLGIAEATTPPFCVDSTNPAFRFTVKNSASIGIVNTWINFTASNGQTLTVPAKGNQFSLGLWTIASAQPLASQIPSLFLGSGTTATISFHALQTSTAAGIQIDNVMVDPYRRG